MKNKTLIYIIIALLLVGLGNYLVNRSRLKNNNSQPVLQDRQFNKNNCLADNCLLVEDLEYPAGELSEKIKDVLDKAIDDEYKALSTYEAVIEKFGLIRPFSMIKGAEEQHIALLKSVYDKYALDTPKNNWLGKVPIPQTIQEACQLGVDAEIANAKLYKDELLPVVKDYPDITTVFTNLMNASEQKHLPAFDRCK